MNYHCEHIQDVLQMYDAALTFFPNDEYYDGPPRLPANWTSTILLHYINNINWYSDEMMQWFIQYYHDGITVWTSFKRCFQPRLFPFMTHNQLVNWTTYLVLSGVHVEIFDGDSLVTCLTRCCTAVAFTPAYVSPFLTQAEMSAIINSKVVTHHCDINQSLCSNNNNCVLDQPNNVSTTQQIFQQSNVEDLMNLSSHRNKYEYSLSINTQSSQSSIYDYAAYPMPCTYKSFSCQQDNSSNNDKSSTDKQYNEVQTILETDDVMTTSNRYHVIETDSMVSSDTNCNYSDESKGTDSFVSTQTDEIHNSKSWININQEHQAQDKYRSMFNRYTVYQVTHMIGSTLLTIMFIETIIHIMHVQWNLLHYTATSFITISGIPMITLFNFMHDTRTTVAILRMMMNFILLLLVILQSLHTLDTNIL